LSSLDVLTKSTTVYNKFSLDFLPYVVAVLIGSIEMTYEQIVVMT